MQWESHRGPTDSEWSQAISQCGINVDRSFSLLSLRDPAAATEHCGLAPEVICRIWDQHRAQVLTVIRTIKMHMEARVARAPNNRHTFCYMCWCRSGKHRSVAVCRIMHFIFQQLSIQVIDTSKNRKSCVCVCRCV